MVVIVVVVGETLDFLGGSQSDSTACLGVVRPVLRTVDSKTTHDALLAEIVDTKSSFRS